MRRRQVLAASVASLPLASLPLASFAQTAAKSVRLIVPFPAGGATDVLGRALGQKLAEKLGSAVIVDNKPGAGGSIGSDLAAKAAPDGLTLLLATSSTHSIGPILNPKLPYDAQADFTPVGLVCLSPNVVLVPQSSPAKTMREFIALAKSKPGQLNYASSGNGTIVHLSTELFKAATGTFIVHIPYRGTALAIPDLISGKLDVMFDSLVSGMPHVRDGKLRALGITTAQPSPLAPGMPTVAADVPGYESVTWFGLYGPKGMPADVTRRINVALNASLAEADLKDRFQRLGAQTQPDTADAFAQFVQRDRAKWAQIIAQRKITLDS